METIRAIRTEEDYEAALARVSELMDALSPPQGQIDDPEDSRQIEFDVLFDLVEHYEDQHYPMPPPDPIAAIEFRMDQAGLNQRDLIPFIGSRAKVSEVLSGKRDITMSMARALHKHLGIPADALIQEPGAGLDPTFDEIDPRRFPLKPMAKLGWIEDVPDLIDRAEELISGLIDRAGGREIAAAATYYRKNDNRRINAKTDPYALMAWCWQTLATANNDPPKVRYESGNITPRLLRAIATLSASEENGPLGAKNVLEAHGIALVVLPHLSRTHLDGAALRLAEGRPVIGLTLRYDRIDNFWFCLLHELAHVACHMDERDESFVDDMRLPSDDAREFEADEWAQEALIPRSAWDASDVQTTPTAMNVIDLANEVGVHPAIVAGRVRYERNNYRLLSQFVGTGRIRRHFETVA